MEVNGNLMIGFEMGLLDIIDLSGFFFFIIVNGELWIRNNGIIF